jgi:hypothetical protein
LLKIFRGPGPEPLLIFFYFLQPLISHQSQYSVLLKLLLGHPNCSKFSGGPPGLLTPTHLLIFFYLLQLLISHQSQYSVLLKLLLGHPNCSKFPVDDLQPSSPGDGLTRRWPYPATAFTDSLRGRRAQHASRVCYRAEKS